MSPFNATASNLPFHFATSASTTAPETTASLASTPAAQTLQENLDDPDTHDWEYAVGVFFGDEPLEDTIDVWGCGHKFRQFMKEDVVAGWVQDLRYLDCQNCFEVMKLWEAEKPLEEGRAAVAKGIKRTRDEAEDLVPETTKSQPVTLRPGAKAKEVQAVTHRIDLEDDVADRGRRAWECKKCGVIYCQRCRIQWRPKGKEA